MKFNYNGELMMPSNCVVVGDNEMEYLNGGWSATVNGTLGSIRTRLSAIVNACFVGDVASIALGAVGELACKIIGGACAAWFTNILSKASSAHTKAESLIRKYGKSRKCKMTSTWAILWCTGISVSI